MNELIPITDHGGKQAVDARQLHEFLESKQQFTDWIKSRIDKYGFIENQDYVTFHKIMKRETGATTLTEYALTLDCAKEISMVEGSAKGKQARQYFIDCEKQLREASTHRIPQTFSEALMLAARQAGQLEIAENTIREQAPKVEYFDTVLQSKSTYTMTQVAKELDMSAIALTNRLHALGVLFRQSGQWLLYGKYAGNGYTSTKTYPFTRDDGSTGTNTITVWTEAGRMFVHQVMRKEY